MRPNGPQAPVVGEVDERRAIAEFRARIVEHCGIERGGNVLVAAGIAACQGEAGIAQLAEDAAIAVAVQVLRDAVVGGRRIVFGVEQVLPAAVIARCRQQQFGAVFIAFAVAQPLLVGAMAGKLARRFKPVDVVPALGDDADDAEHGIAAVNGGTGTAHDLDPVDEVHVDHAFRADGSLVVHRIVEAVAVQQQQHAAVVVARPAGTPHAQIRIRTVIGDVHATHASQNIGQRTVAISLDVRGRDDGHGGRCLDGFLGELAGAVNLD